MAIVRPSRERGQPRQLRQNPSHPNCESDYGQRFSARISVSIFDAVLLSNGALRFHTYLDGGTPAAPSNVMTAGLKSNDGEALEQWDGTALSHLPTSAIANEFAYNRFAPGPFGLRAEMGAMATITLPVTSNADPGSLHSAATLQLHTVNGNTLNVAVRME
jgi:hypothetical protein